MRTLPFALLVTMVTLQISYHTVEASCWKYYKNYFSCPAKAIRAQTKAMKSADCLNCDQYFHCKGNFNAMQCSGDVDKNRKLAEATSECREGDSDSADSADSQAVQAAMLFGRDGGNCEAEYLCKAGCSWSPSQETCARINCL